jgi:hypothetical protein
MQVYVGNLHPGTRATFLGMGTRKLLKIQCRQRNFSKEDSDFQTKAYVCLLVAHDVSQLILDFHIMAPLCLLAMSALLVLCLVLSTGRPFFQKSLNFCTGVMGKDV